MPNNSLQTINIENRILVIRGQQVMLDRDLAELYGVETKREFFASGNTRYRQLCRFERTRKICQEINFYIP